MRLWVEAEGRKPHVSDRAVKKYPGSLRLRKTCSLVTSLTETPSCHYVSTEIPFWAVPTFSLEKESLAQDNTPENKLPSPKLGERSRGIHSLSPGEFDLQGWLLVTFH